MTSIKHRQLNTSPEIEYTEIDIPDDKNLGTGSFTTLLKPNVLSSSRVIMSISLNVPVFQISVNINASTREIPVLLGRADGTDPISRKVFLLPVKVDPAVSHMLIANFKNWQVIGLDLDGTLLTEKKSN